MIKQQKYYVGVILGHFGGLMVSTAEIILHKSFTHVRIYVCVQLRTFIEMLYIQCNEFELYELRQIDGNSQYLFM